MLTSLDNKKIKISLPKFFKFACLNEFFILLQENQKQVFNDNFEITSAEGCFPCSIWSLERDQIYTAKSEMECVIDMYSNHNIPIYYIFDNDCLSEDDLSDNFSNLMLKLAHREGNGIYVKSDILYKYIKTNFPLYKLIRIAIPKDFNRKEIAIIDKYNNSFDESKIKNKKSTYITLNPICSSECKHYDAHRIYWGNEQINFTNITDIYICHLKKDFDFYNSTNNPNFISMERMKKYIDDGFENFRIYSPAFANNIGIIYNICSAIESYIYYLIKPEYQQEIRLQILQKIESSKNEKI